MRKTILEAMDEYFEKETPLEEMNVTADIDGGFGQPQTPHAFQSKPKSALDKKKEDDLEDAVPFVPVQKTNVLFKQITEMNKKIERILKQVG